MARKKIETQPEAQPETTVAELVETSEMMVRDTVANVSAPIPGVEDVAISFIESEAKKNSEFMAAALRVHEGMRAELDAQPGFEEIEGGSAVAHLEDHCGKITESPNAITLLQGDNIRLSREVIELRERMDRFAHVVLQNWGKVI